MQGHQVKRSFALYGACAAIALGVAACAQVAETSMLLVSSRAPVAAIINGQLVQGELRLHTDRTGTLDMQGGSDSSIASCVGQLHFTSTAAGIIDLRCSGGVNVALKFTQLTETKGFAYGETPAHTASMAYGLAPREAKAYLTVPAGKQLVEVPNSWRLELR